MIYKSHTIELFINGQKADLESQKSLNLRFQNVLFNPEKISSSQAEYSFEFELPSTPTNDKMFDYANNLSKVGKFRSRLNAEVYADGTPIFTGTLTLNGYKDKQYKCNLVSVKVYSLDEIFGDSKLSEIDNWYIHFNGPPTIDAYNNNPNTKVVFPLISYGAFQKSPVYSDEVGKTYTSKYDMDEYNRWYVESFYPSLNMLETIKKAFEYKGYKVGGDAFTDPVLNEIFMSTNLADGQSPVYNLGNPNFGKLSITTTFTTTDVGYIQDLKYPYYKVAEYMFDSESGLTLNGNGDDKFNFERVQIYDMLDEGSVTVNLNRMGANASYIYQPDEHLIVIPADGFYKIHMRATASLMNPGEVISHTVDGNERKPTQYTSVLNATSVLPPAFKITAEETTNVTMTKDFATTTPLEIALVRNYDDNYELIKGKWNMEYLDGFQERNCFLDTECQGNNNYLSYVTCFPHEKLGRNYKTITSGGIPTKGGDLISGEYVDNTTNFGYVYNNNETMAYDPVVSPIFICGFSTMGNQNGSGATAVVKNGYSWSRTYSERTDSMYIQTGYYNTATKNGAGTRSAFNQNTYPDAPTSYISGSSTPGFSNIVGEVYCCVWLNKNDVLQLLAVHRDYEDEEAASISYVTTQQVVLDIEAASPDTIFNLRAKNFGYDSPTEFPLQLNLAQFLNKEKKISEFVQNVTDAFNLEILQNGKNVELNVKKKFNRNLLAAVDLDNRVNSDSAEASKIDYPSSMAVKYKIDTDEHGFYDSVPSEHINDPDWKNYGESGYSIVRLNDDTYVTNSSDKNLQFSYTWYDDFNWFPVDSAFTKTSTSSTTLNIPVISKEEYMIDGYDYSESLKHDGYGLAQRFWFRPTATQQYVWTRTYPVERINIYTTSNVYNNVNLSYKVTENSLLKRYFNITPYLASNYVEVEAYLTPDEYNMIKNGALIHFDSDIYYPVEVNGYDPSAYNPTEIKMMKKL